MNDRTFRMILKLRDWPLEQWLALVRDNATGRLPLRAKLTRMMIGGKP